MLTRVAAWPSAWIAILVIALMSVRVVEQPRAPAPESGRCIGVGALEVSWCAIRNDLDDNSDKLALAVTAVATARSDADLVAAHAELTVLQHEQDELNQRARTFQQAVAQARRAVRVHISANCLANPLAAGCH